MFIQVIQGRCTKQDELRSKLDQWVDEQAPTASGWLGGTYGFTDDDTFVGVVRFESREAAAANGERPEQGEWWSDVEKSFDGPVEFRDCDDVTLMLGGGSDDAGFVQVIQGKVGDPEKFKEMMGRGDELKKIRPEILGATLAFEADGTFTETVAFTDEEAAHRGEQAEVPADVSAEWENLLHDVSYLDLHQPWFASKR